MVLKMMYDVMINKKLCFEQPRNISKNFLICKSCFWCASFLDQAQRSVEVCPSCMNSELESMPLSFDETYKFNYDARSGVTLEFGRTK